MEMDIKEFEDIKKGLKCLPEFKDLEIKESWLYDINRLDDEIKTKQKLLRVVKRERKLQPEVKTINALTNEERILYPGYQIGISSDKKCIHYCKDW